jgi:hypothetical protein
LPTSIKPEGAAIEVARMQATLALPTLEATTGTQKRALEKMVSGPLGFTATAISDFARRPIAPSAVCKSADDWSGHVWLLLPKSLRDILVAPVSALCAIYRRSEPASNFRQRSRYRVFSSSRWTVGGPGAYVTWFGERRLRWGWNFPILNSARSTAK